VKATIIAAVLAGTIASAPLLAGDCQPALRLIIAKRLNNFSYLDRVVPRYSFMRDILVNAENRAAINKSAKKVGVEIPSEMESISDVLNHVAIELRRKNTDRQSAADKMASFGEEIRSKIGTTTKENLAAFDASVGLAVIRLESFKKSEYIIDENFTLAEGAKAEIKPNEYWEWVKSYISDSGIYKESTTNKGVIGAEEYRDITSHNHWPVYLKDHDIRHIHFSLSHPKAMSVLLSTMRSTNHKRSAILSAMFEGVDHVQFSYESKLAKYMAEQRGMNLEQAMLHIARAKNAELDRIMSEAKITDSINEVISEMSSWQPKLGGKFSDLGPKDKKYDLEVDEMIESFDRFGKEGSEMDRRMLEYTQNPKTETGPIAPEASDAIRIRYNNYSF
jgi:hypothetical protein